MFATSNALRRYADTQLAAVRGEHQRRRGLLETLRTQVHPTLNCDDGFTRNAADARHLGLPVRCQKVHVRESCSRADTLTFSSGHVGLVLTT